MPRYVHHDIGPVRPAGSHSLDLHETLPPLTPSPPQLRPENKRRVLIYGVGGLGHQAVQLAKHLGQTVFAVDIRPGARALALKLGAEKAFHPGELQDIFAQQPASGQRFAVDVVFDFVAGTQCESNCLLP